MSTTVDARLAELRAALSRVHPAARDDVLTQLREAEAGAAVATAAQ
jgi:hypothetical protein